MANTYYLINSYTVGAGGVSTITFSSIPQTYTDLIMHSSIRTEDSGSFNGALKLTFNSGGSYSSRRFVNSTYNISDGASFLRVSNNCPSASENSYTFSNSSFYVYNYTNSRIKTTGEINVSNANTNGAYKQAVAGKWYNGLWGTDTDAITSITLTAESANISQNSTVYLYGIKNS